MLRIILLLISSHFLFNEFYAQSETVRVIGDSLVGKVIGGENVRVVTGNVKINQGNVNITCRQAIQFLKRNEVELLGNVLVKQDSVVIRTERGYYYGREKISYSDTSVYLDDGHIQLSADTGYYYFNEEKALFISNVNLYEGFTKLFSNRLTYFNKLDEAVALGDVIVSDTATIIFADSLQHSKSKNISIAYSNVKIVNEINNIIITGDKLEDFGDSNLTRITGHPVLIQIDTSSTGIVDSLIITSLIMETIDDSSAKLIAKDSVRIVRGAFASENEFTLYFRDDKKIVTFKTGEREPSPVMWYENTQLTGDSITIFTKENQIDWINIDRNAFILTSNEKYNNRYDQISGRNIKMYFSEGRINKTIVNGGVLSIYYMYEDGEANGLIKSSAENINIFFDSSKVSDVKMYGTPASEYHPENLVKGNEKEFTLPSFKIYLNRPKKESILQLKKRK